MPRNYAKRLEKIKFLHWRAGGHRFKSCIVHHQNRCFRKKAAVFSNFFVHFPLHFISSKHLWPHNSHRQVKICPLEEGLPEGGFFVLSTPFSCPEGGPAPVSSPRSALPDSPYSPPSIPRHSTGYTDNTFRQYTSYSYPINKYTSDFADRSLAAVLGGWYTFTQENGRFKLVLICSK